MKPRNFIAALAYAFVLSAILCAVSSAQLQQQGHALIKTAEAKPGQIVGEVC